MKTIIACICLSTSPVQTIAIEPWHDSIQEWHKSFLIWKGYRKTR